MPVYVITGARGGIGLEYVRQLAENDANTIFALVRDLNGNLAALKTIQERSTARLHILECDTSSESSVGHIQDQIRSLIGSGSKIDVLINNAAVLNSRHETSVNVSSSALLSHITTNVLGPAMVLQALLPLLAPNARVANISSGVGSMTMLSDGRIKAEITPYSISKAALNMLTVHQAQHLADRDGSGILVVSVDPGYVKTEMGGPNATVEVSDSARGVLRTLAALKPGDSGKFLLYTGDELPW